MSPAEKGQKLRKDCLSGFRRPLGSSLVVAGAPGLGERPSQDEVDLAVEATEIVVGPALERLEEGRIEPEEERFSIGHGGYG